jgi:hypothetical protein
MDCRRADDAMEAVLNGDEPQRRDLEAHLNVCPDCRARWHELTQLDGALRLVCNTADVDAGGRERAIARVIRGIHAPRTPTATAAHAFRWAAVGVPLLLVGFGSGLCAGRTLWPRQEVVRVPQWRERVVTVKVPFVEERVIVERVPVVHTRVLYRDRTPAPHPEEDANQTHAAVQARTPGVPRAATFTASSAKLTTIVLGFNLELSPSKPVLTREIRPASSEEPAEAEPATQEEEGSVGVGSAAPETTSEPRVACAPGDGYEAR